MVEWPEEDDGSGREENEGGRKMVEKVVKPPSYEGDDDVYVGS